MDQDTSSQTSGGTLTWERVVAGAIKQAARHEHALQACLAELGGRDEPMSDLADATRRRAMRHAERALGLTRTAIRLNRDPLSEPFLAALLERHERAAMQVERMLPAEEERALSIAG
jgi:LmbE family N-acetylglucosaminyl deacetylase